MNSNQGVDPNLLNEFAYTIGSPLMDTDTTGMDVGAPGYDATGGNNYEYHHTDVFGWEGYHDLDNPKYSPDDAKAQEAIQKGIASVTKTIPNAPSVSLHDEVSAKLVAAASVDPDHETSVRLAVQTDSERNIAAAIKGIGLINTAIRTGVAIASPAADMGINVCSIKNAKNKKKAIADVAVDATLAIVKIPVKENIVVKADDVVKTTVDAVKSADTQAQ
jgi:hypothetical protein